MSVDLIEQERTTSGAMTNFHDNHPLYPGYYPQGLNIIDEDGYWVEALHGGVEGVGVGMKDNTGHVISPHKGINVLVQYYNENKRSCQWEHMEMADTHSTQPRNLAYVG